MNKTALLIISILTFSVSFAQTSVLTNSSATAEASALFNKLMKLSEKHVMFGHQDDLAYGMGWWAEADRSDVKEVSGSYPAVFGWDIGHIGEARNIDSISFDKMKTWIKKVHKMGGVNTISWHIRNPVNKSSSWDTEEAVVHILPGGKLHNYYKEQLDKVAEFMGDLKINGSVDVPVIFRPYHEVTGSWFWWGGNNVKPEDYFKLWRFTKNYLEKEKGINNLIWCYSTDRFKSRAEYLKFYPGDNFVDILGFDDYHSPMRNPKQFVDELKTVISLAKEKNKLATFSETGLEKIPVKDYWTNILLKGIKEGGMGISYVLVWRNGRPDHYYAPYPGQISADDFNKFKSNNLILFLDELNELNM